MFEHISFTFAVSNVSRVLLAQYSRHRVGVSLSVQSQRHVRPIRPFKWPRNAVAPNHPVPPIVGFIQLVDPPTLEEVFTANSELKRQYHEMVGQCFTVYDHLIEAGVPKEDARFVLPQGVATNFVTTVNLRSLAHLYRLRVQEPGAQWEIRELVLEMVKLVILTVPELGEITGLGTLVIIE